jgi:hypothetical protein
VKTYATIKKRSIRISGWPHSGWRAAENDDPDGKAMNFSFHITDDGSGNYLLAYHSLDNVYCADSWHETLQDAYSCAADIFGIQMQEWSPPTGAA